MNVEKLLDKAAGLMADDKFRDAMAVLKKVSAAKLKKKPPRYYAILGRLQQELNLFDEAIKTLSRLEEIDPHYRNLNYLLAEAYVEKRLVEKSILYYGKHLKQYPDSRKALIGIGLALELVHRYDEAAVYYQKILDKNPKDSTALMYRGDCMKYVDVNQKEISEIKEVLSSPYNRKLNQVHCYFALGKAYEDCLDYEKAALFYHLGNATQWGRYSFDFAEDEKRINEHLDFFSEEVFATLEQHGSKDTDYVFVVGLPRSGKSLVEQVICQSRNDAVACDETAILSRLSRRTAKFIQSEIGFPQNLLHEPQKNIPALAEACRQQYQAYRNETSKRLLIDTTPNYHRLVGFIRVLFPQAKFVFCRRNLQDHCLQLYKTYFSSRILYSYNLNVMQAYLELFHKQMLIWQQRLGDQIFVVDYERLVAQPQKIRNEIFSHFNMDVHVENPAILENFRSGEVGLADAYASYLKV